MRTAKVCRYCQSTAFQSPCEHCGEPKHRSEHDQQRGTSAERGYGNRWRRWRESVIRRMRATGEWNGYCDRCGKAILKTIHVDHIIPVQSRDDVRFFDRTNIQFLHPTCHSEKTIEDKKRGATR